MTVRRIAGTAAQCLLAVVAIACFVMGLPRATRVAAPADVPAQPAAKIAPALPLATGRVVRVSTEAMLQAAVREIASNTTIVLTPGTYRLSSTLWINRAVTNVAIRGATGIATTSCSMAARAERGAAWHLDRGGVPISRSPTSQSATSVSTH
jgi:hypothetical protein